MHTQCSLLPSHAKVSHGLENLQSHVLSRYVHRNQFATPSQHPMEHARTRKPQTYLNPLSLQPTPRLCVHVGYEPDMLGQIV